MDSLIGKTIDGYKILEVLGRGGMGVVFKALDESLDKIVALKMIDPFLARDENFVKRFKTEAKALARLENPNIVRVHALRKTEFGFFMVMEFVDAKSVSHWIQDKGPFNLKDTMSITKQLLNVFDHAHKAGVIHRDIKPSNIMLSEDGNVKVLDFGLAKVIRKHGAASTVTQTKAGSLYYMSPEQIKGLKNVDKRSDLYSLGMTIYEMVAGRTPFDKTDSDFTIQKKIVDGNIPSPVKFGSDIPKQFVKLILKAINKEPDKRFQSADEMLKAAIIFERHISPKPDAAPKPASTISFYKQPIFFISVIAFLIVALLYLVIDPFGKPAPDSVVLSISTEPNGAEIYIDEDSLGDSPIREHIIEEEGDIKIQIKKAGYIAIDTVFAIEFGTVFKTFTLTAKGKGLITISSQPTGARIFVNDDSIGIAPIGRHSVESGQYLLRVEKIGFITIDSLVTVQKGQPQSFIFNLVPVPTEPNLGGIRITSNPKGASVWLNDEFVGSTPFESGGLPPTTYKLLIEKNGYANYFRKSVNVQKNKITPITKTMVKIGQLSITTQPSRAKIYLDDQYIGRTRIRNRAVPIGEHTVILQKDGYKPITKTITIAHNKRMNISETLTQLMGKVEISVQPFGSSIYVDDVLKTTDTSTPYKMDLPGGKHNIKAVHPSLGSQRIEIDITNEEPQKIDIDFNLRFNLTVTSEPNNCEIFVDGVSTGKNTPSVVKLIPGNHTIQLRKDGYQTKQNTFKVDNKLYVGQKDKKGRIEFTLIKNE
jgi:serine/threonine protein kinase